MTTEAEIRALFKSQAASCDRLGSPFTARLLEGLGERLDDSSATGHTILNWQQQSGNLTADALPLRLSGALSGLVRAGNLPDLAKYYPPHPLDVSGLIPAALKAIQSADQSILGWLESAPQTNEVARAALVYPGLMQVAAVTGLPMEVWEVGTSGGLNLNLDRFAYVLGGQSFGDTDSDVRLQPDWTGPAPTGPKPQIVARKGCDLNPLDPRDADNASRLLSYIWPDQSARIARTEAAIAIANTHPIQLDTADAADWVEQNLATPAPSGRGRVLFHTIAHQYFPNAVQARIETALHSAGAKATDEAPLGWLAFEFEGNDPLVTLRMWPGGKRRVLARADPHVRAVEWLA